VFLVDPLLALVLKGHKEEHATDYIVLVFNAYRKWLDGADEEATMAWLESRRGDSSLMEVLAGRVGCPSSIVKVSE
ncbi:hypothetical protein J5H61_17050, partial [Pseudomonas asiatica]|nr:hypothetical protein [Pseudomonas asiatica]